MSDVILEVKNLSKSFGGVQAVKNVSFHVKRGEILGIIGPNGSGKTTIVNLITGFVKPDSGRVIFKGRDITGYPPHKVADLGIVRTFQIPRPFHRLPTYKNLVIPLYSPRAKRNPVGRYGDREHVSLDILEDLGIERYSPYMYAPAGSIPPGFIRRLELARCLCLNPEIIITDELFSGLSAAEVSSLVPIIEKLNMKGYTFIMIEHRLRDLFRLANRVIVLDGGVKIAEGTPEEITNDPRVVKAYMGVEVA